MFPQTAGSSRKLSERERIAHLLNRAGFGPWPGEVDRVLKAGARQYVESQLYPDRLNDSELDRWESAFELLSTDGKQARQMVGGNPQPILNQLLAHKMMRAIHSQRQLLELMVDFWFNHFNVEWGKEDVRYLCHRYERDVIRPLAFARFGDLLLATAKHPAMLVYLDNALSSSPKSTPTVPGRQLGINENYARELMELHTLGVDGGYTQKDVEEVARCFTGWTVDPEDLVFRFDDAMHDPGEKTVLGNTVPSGGYEEGLTVLKLLVAHPSTARFIATKLVRRFVADDPPKTLVDRVAAVFEQTSGDIREMCRSILLADEFYDPNVYRTKVKSPLELVVSSVRAVDATVKVPRNTTIAPLVRVMMAETEESMGAAAAERMRSLEADNRRAPLMVGLSPDIHAYMHVVEPMHGMGQMPYQVAAPTGYPDRGDHWLNALTSLTRMTFAISLAENKVAGMEFGEAEVKRLAGNVRGKMSWETALGWITGVPGIRPMHSKPAALPAGAAPPAVTKYLAIALGSPDFQHK